MRSESDCVLKDNHAEFNLNTKHTRSREHNILAVQWDGYSEVIREYVKSLVSEMMVGSNDGCKAIEKWWLWSMKGEL